MIHFQKEIINIISLCYHIPFYQYYTNSSTFLLIYFLKMYFFPQQPPHSFSNTKNVFLLKQETSSKGQSQNLFKPSLLPTLSCLNTPSLDLSTALHCNCVVTTPYSTLTLAYTTARLNLHTLSTPLCWVDSTTPLLLCQYTFSPIFLSLSLLSEQVN